MREQPAPSYRRATKDECAFLEVFTECGECRGTGEVEDGTSGRFVECPDGCNGTGFLPVETLGLKAMREALRLGLTSVVAELHGLGLACEATELLQATADERLMKLVAAWAASDVVARFAEWKQLGLARDHADDVRTLVHEAFQALDAELRAERRKQRTAAADAGHRAAEVSS